MTRLKYLFLVLFICLVPLLFMVLDNDSNYPALHWSGWLITSAVAAGLLALMLTLLPLKDITPKNWDKYEEE